MAYYFRKKYIDELLNLKDKHFIKVLTGIRRCGKSTVLVQFMNVLKNDYKINEKQIIYMDFNDSRLVKKYNWETLLNYLESIADKTNTNYLFLDEIQDIKGFENTIITLFEHKTLKFDIYVTGSNSKMLSSELATLFTGRHRDVHIMPLTLKEFNEITNNPFFNKDFYKYAEIGGLGIIIPHIDNPGEAKETLKNVLQDVIQKDVRKRHHNTSNLLIDKTIKYALSNIGVSISPYKTCKKVNKQDDEKMTRASFSNYLQWACDAMILYRVDYFNHKTNTILTTSGKYYAGDIGLLNSVVGYSDNTLGYKLENIVLLQLISLGWEVYTLKLYQKNKNSKEVDFVIKKDEVIKYIQVTHTLTNENKKREIDNLLSIKDGYEKIIILINDETGYSTDGVRRIDLMRWLMDEIVI
ncbi:MAG: ATP-binding protein [Mycoplasmataceae bacterium]|nr:ATP-binding protein [Mycoplasmataceae bacterium]